MAFNDPSLTQAYFGTQSAEDSEATVYGPLRALPPSLSTQVSSVQSVRPISGRTAARDVIRTSIAGGGDWTFEFGADEFDIILEAALGALVDATGASTTSASSDITITQTGHLTRYDSAAGSLSSGFAVGDYVRITGATAAGNRGWFPIVAVDETANEDWIDVVNPDGAAASPDTAAITFAYDEQFIIGGEKPFLSIELVDSDPSAIVATELYLNMLVSTFAMTVAHSNLIQCSVNFQGNDPTSGVAKQRGGADTLGPLNPGWDTRPLNGHDDVVSVGWYNGSAGYSFLNKIPELTWNVDNGVGQQLVVGQVGPAAVAQDTPTLGATVNLLIEDNRLLSEVLGSQNETSVFGFGASEGDASGEAKYGFGFTNAKLSDLGRGQEAQNLPFFRNASLGATAVKITKFTEA